MGVPGFTAEASLRESNYSYRTLLGSNGSRSNARNPVVATLSLLGRVPPPPEPVSCLLRALYCESNGGFVYSYSSPACAPGGVWIGCNQCCYFIH